MIFPEHRLILVHNQKTGGNSICAALGKNADCPEKHFLAHELCDLYGKEAWASSFKFGFVRNPWDRLVSWYSMIDSRRERAAAGAKLSKFQTFILQRAASFEQFLRNCDEEIADTDGRKWIFRNQIDYFTDFAGKNLMVDYIGRFEHLERDISVITTLAGLKQVTLPRFNPSSHGRYTAYYTPELADIVAARYERDIRLFSYTFGG